MHVTKVDTESLLTKASRFADGYDNRNTAVLVEELVRRLRFFPPTELITRMEQGDQVGFNDGESHWTITKDLERK